MKDIFTDLYKKVAGFFQAPSEKENVKEVACNRLKFVLMQDRTNLTPQLLERMRSEMIDLLSKYVEMDKEALELNFAHEGESMALMLSIPVLRAKEESEIQAIIEAEEKAKMAKEALEAEEAAEAEEEISDEDESPEEVDAEVDVEPESEPEEVCGCGCEENEADEACPCGDECEEIEEDVIEDAPVKKSKKK